MPIVIRSLDGSPIPQGLEEVIANLLGEGVGGNLGAESPEVEPELKPVSEEETIVLSVDAVQAFANSVIALQQSMDHMQEFASKLLTAAQNEAIYEQIAQNEGFIAEGERDQAQPSEEVAQACDAAVNADSIEKAIDNLARGYAFAVYRTPWDNLSKETQDNIKDHVRQHALVG